MRGQVNIGLIGAGRLGTMYAEYLSYRVPKANLIAVAATHSLNKDKIVNYISFYLCLFVLVLNGATVVQSLILAIVRSKNYPQSPVSR